MTHAIHVIDVIHVTHVIEELVPEKTGRTGNRQDTLVTSDWLTALAAAGSAALVSAASTDAWQATRDRFVRLLGRDDAECRETAARHLDALRGIAREPGGDSALADARRVWRVHLRDFLAEHPDAAGELRSAIAALPAPDAAPTYRQDVKAQDHATVYAFQHSSPTIHQTRPGTPHDRQG
ncbi:hypothetical protein GCM10010129_74730 [Streptomyces fumigatiscleroticus]|nr:hypothetical protein GCM10010129_74730 [Streptomyces fumigatiscleroticus]